MSCVCHLVLPRPASPHESAVACALCTRHLFPVALDNAMDTLVVLNEKLINQKNACELLQHENEALQARVRVLEGLVATHQQDNDVLARKLIAEAEMRAQLLAENDNINQELNELTEKLFNEANNLVSVEARRRFEAEKSSERAMTELQEARRQLCIEQEQLKELRGKIEKYAAEEESLGHLFHSRAAMSRVGLDNPGFAGTDAGAAILRRFPSLPLDTTLPNPTQVFDARLFVEFQAFVEEVAGNPAARLSSLYFFKRCVEEDVEPCLRHVGRMALRRLLPAFQDQTLEVELIPHSSQLSGSPEECDCCGYRRFCSYRYRARPSDPWRVLDRFCRDRFVAVGDFYSLIRHVAGGLFSGVSTKELYHEFSRLRRRIFYARIGCLHLFPSKKSYLKGFLQNGEFGSTSSVSSPTTWYADSTSGDRIPVFSGNSTEVQDDDLDFDALQDDDSDDDDDGDLSNDAGDAEHEEGRRGAGAGARADADTETEAGSDGSEPGDAKGRARSSSRIRNKSSGPTPTPHAGAEGEEAVARLAPLDNPLAPTSSLQGRFRSKTMPDLAREDRGSPAPHADSPRPAASAVDPAIRGAFEFFSRRSKSFKTLLRPAHQKDLSAIEVALNGAC